MKSTQEIYQDLMVLCEKHKEFFFNDHVLNGETYRIFDYRLASYSMWLLPSALECRGITFLLDDNKEMVTCVSRPMCKFFNMSENTMTMNLDLSTLVSIQTKMDGSLISTMQTFNDNSMYLKSKGSLTSPQALAANSLINTSKFKKLREFLSDSAYMGVTVCLEYTAPNNRIVLGYEEPNLTVLAIRDNETGRYVNVLEVGYANGITKFCVEEHINTITDKETFIASIKDMQGIEGFVCHLADGTSFKIKTDAYLALHKLKDSINSVPQLFECVLVGASDDLRAAYFDDELAIKQIDKMEKLVSKLYSETVQLVEFVYNQNKHLERREYAIKCKEEVPVVLFGLVMNLYLGRENNYVDFFIKNRIYFGITQELFY